MPCSHIHTSIIPYIYMHVLTFLFLCPGTAALAKQCACCRAKFGMLQTKHWCTVSSPTQHTTALVSIGHESSKNSQWAMYYDRWS
jgi:hypothetical protein